MYRLLDSFLWAVAIVLVAVILGSTFVQCTTIIADTARMRNAMSYESGETWEYTGAITVADGEFIWHTLPVSEPLVLD